MLNLLVELLLDLAELLHAERVQIDYAHTPRQSPACVNEDISKFGDGDGGGPGESYLSRRLLKPL